MSETRVLPKANPRSTGIPRTTKAVQRPQVGTGASNLSASPSAGKAASDRVLDAQRRQVGLPATPGSESSPGPAGNARPLVRVNGRAALPEIPELDEAEGALIANLIAGVLHDPSTPDELHAIAKSALDKLAQIMGHTLARQDAMQVDAPQANNAMQTARASTATVR